MAKASKFTDEQKFEIALEMLGGKLSLAKQAGRKWDAQSSFRGELE